MPTLSTLPPELLLQILTHLPLSSLHPLNQTSHALQTFLTTHAHTICNTYILSHSILNRASSILGATYNSNGWLVPSHPCIRAAETRIIRDKILFSGCGCMDCRDRLRKSSPTSTTLGSAGSEISLPEQAGLGRRMLCFPSSPSPPFLVCKAGLAHQDGTQRKMIKLSECGPQFAIFLEKYAWSIVARWEMYHRGSLRADDSPLSPTLTATSTLVESPGAVDEGGDKVEDEAELSLREREERRRADAMFSFGVGNYCVRIFLEDVEKGFEKIDGFANANVSEVEEATNAWVKMRDRCRKYQAGFGVVKNKFRQVGLNSCLGRRKRVEREKTPRPRMMFGEIPSDEDVVTDEKRPVVEEWMMGLLWWHGVRKTQLQEKAVESVEEKPNEKRGRVAKMRSCSGGLKLETARVGTKLKGVWGMMRCTNKEGGVFQSLDD